ncbi:MAG: sensor histidine kinase [Lachnospiraceae bacterium]|nr:sensor histidine kinase [Lachnospiraceae bacterium]
MRLIKGSYKRRMFFSFLALSIVFILVSGIVSVQLFRVKIGRDFVANDVEAFAKITERLSAAFDEVGQAIEQIGNNDILKGAASGNDGNFRLINSELFASTRQIREYSNTDIYNGGNCVFSTSASIPKTALPLYFSTLKRADEADGGIAYSEVDKGDDAFAGTFKMVRKLTDKGYCIIRIDYQGFDKLLEGLVGSGKGFMLVNEYWEPVYATGTANKGTLETFRQNLFDGKDYNRDFQDNAYARKIGDGGLWGIYITPPVMIGSAVRSMYTVILLLTAISIGLSFLMSNRLSNSLSHPIGNLTRAMKRLRSGDLSTRMETDRDDEFGQLATGFNKMAEQLERHVEEQIENEKELNRTQIGMVTAQLNPHFLYNTLDTIKWLAKDNGVNTIADLSSKLAKILRRSISGPAFCTLNDELELIRNYCDIQAVRFDNKFEVEIQSEEDIGECLIPKLIIQPVVENSIIHGFEDCDSGKIQIEIRKVGMKGNSYPDDAETDRTAGKGYLAAIGQEAGRPCGGIIVISVTDNGSGIDPEIALKLRNRDKEGLAGHIGMFNVDTIIRLNYGPEYGLTAERTGESGTKVTITLPAMK